MNNLLGSNPDKKNYTTKVNELHTDLVNWLNDRKSVHYEGVKNRNLTGIPLSTGSIDVPEDRFRIFPNPASGQVTFDSYTAKIDGVEFYNVFGQKIYTYNHSFTGRETIDLPSFKGICMVKPLGMDSFSAMKLIVN
jgi:hypothetical protein